MKRFIKMKFLFLIAIKPLNITIFNVISFCINIKILKYEIFYASAKKISRIIYERKYFKEFTLKEIKEKLIKCTLFK